MSCAKFASEKPPHMRYPSMFTKIMPSVSVLRAGRMTFPQPRTFGRPSTGMMPGERARSDLSEQTSDVVS
jgi:hypothetical protein